MTPAAEVDLKTNGRERRGNMETGFESLLSGEESGKKEWVGMRMDDGAFYRRKGRGWAS